MMFHPALEADVDVLDKTVDIEREALKVLLNYKVGLS
jgi:hypothetical protein